jgi:alanine racemase
VLARLEIHLGAIRRNAAKLAALIAPAALMTVVKANAYGHGLVEVSRALRGVARRFGVYSLEEAVALREAGITEPILVTGPIEPGDLKTAVEIDASIAFWSIGTYAGEATTVARAKNARLRIHAKIDTGVARLGLTPKDAPEAIRSYLRTPQLQLEGIFSHLAAAEELDSPYTEQQLAVFDRVLDAVQYELADLEPAPIRHIAASAAAMLWPQTRLDLVRAGIAIYGLWPSPEMRNFMSGHKLDLAPALSWKTELVAVREVPAGASVGYGRTYTAAKAMRVGVLPIGYAEGLPRLASNRGAVLVDGMRCPIVGRICMDMTMVDITAVRNPRPGIPVTLIGRDGVLEITADDWASWAQTINYEIVSRIPEHVPRRFLAPPESDGI